MSAMVTLRFVNSDARPKEIVMSELTQFAETLRIEEAILSAMAPKYVETRQSVLAQISRVTALQQIVASLEAAKAPTISYVDDCGEVTEAHIRAVAVPKADPQ